jgi:S-DNA-T family DNA segregation ATPase FtsK/SpoIIIE
MKAEVMGMIVMGLLGAGMFAGAVYKAWETNPKRELKRIIERTLKAMELENVRIARIERIKNGYSVQFKMPAGYTVTEFEKEAKQALDEVSYAGGTKFRKLHGNMAEMQFGYGRFSEKMAYEPEQAGNGTLKVPLYSPFGMVNVDFGDETSCHVLIGGTTRMGKSVLIRLLITHLMRSMDGNIRMYVLDNKITDLYPFKNIPQIAIAETLDEAHYSANEVLEEVARRKQILKDKGDVIDAKDFRKKYPDEPMPPLFVIIDEYARFASDNKFQEKVIEIAETAGFLDVHLVVASQRPDASTVLKPRIRANMLTRISFTTVDETNSMLILDVPDAAHLGRIQGRAVLSDGFAGKVQVPFLSADKAKNLLQPYLFIEENEHDIEGSANRDVLETIPNLEPGPISLPSSEGELEPGRYYQSSGKKAGKGRGNTSRAKKQGEVVPLRDEPANDSHTVL